MFDQFTARATGRRRLIAFEMWPGALDSTAVWTWMQTRARTQKIEISHRDGTWQELATD